MKLATWRAWGICPKATSPDRFEGQTASRPAVLATPCHRVGSQYLWLLSFSVGSVRGDLPGTPPKVFSANQPFFLFIQHNQTKGEMRILVIHKGLPGVRVKMASPGSPGRSTSPLTFVSHSAHSPSCPGTLVSAPQRRLSLVCRQPLVPSLSSLEMLRFPSQHLKLANTTICFSFALLYAFTISRQALWRPDCFPKGNSFSKIIMDYVCVTIIHHNYGCVKEWLIDRHGNARTWKGNAHSISFSFAFSILLN